MSLISNYYIDKTPFIMQTNCAVNTEQRFLFVATPSGFGKTHIIVLANTVQKSVLRRPVGKRSGETTVVWRLSMMQSTSITVPEKKFRHPL